jgi:hypothetical protein
VTTPLFLTTDELVELTGYQKPKKQAAWLKSEGFTHRIAADGHPRVDRAHYLKLMGGSADAATVHRRTEPNFDNLISFPRRA